MTTLEEYFRPYRDNIIGIGQKFDSPYGEQELVYADWTASGRMYRPIEEKFLYQIAPFVANTHTETNTTGCSMTLAYHKSKEIIKNHVNAAKTDVLISSNSGMTGVINKFQRMLGLRLHENFRDHVEISKYDTPIIFVTHMEHHSNQTSWIETIGKVVIIPANEEGLVCLKSFGELLEEYKDYKIKYAAVTSCSNVTGIKTPYHQIAKMIHQAGGYCFVDFACSAPYIDINMHPADPEEKLDAIYFSPHKFLGGPGSSGILVFCQSLYSNKIPDCPGGGTVDWTNPWGEHKYLDEIEAREDGGTPGFLQTMRVAFCIQLKEQMGVQKILEREEELLDIVWDQLDPIENINILAKNIKKRLGVISFYIDNLHFNLGVKLLNDRFGIQVRGGCSCAGTYGHYLLAVSYEDSHKLTSEITCGILENKPGWMRMSIHPTMTDDEMYYITDAIKELAANHKEWAKDYEYNNKTNEYSHKGNFNTEMMMAENWFLTDAVHA
jgi:selenocysteine lyase/cysteine desulfurase